MRKVLSLALAGVVAVGLLAGCSGGAKYKDGTYTGKSSPDERGAIGEIKITIKDGKIAEAEYKGVQKDGKVKDQEYGKTNGKIENQESYDKAQLAVKANAKFGPELVKKQDVDKVDAVTGASNSSKQFKEAAKAALDQAKK